MSLRQAEIIETGEHVGIEEETLSDGSLVYNVVVVGSRVSFNCVDFQQASALFVILEGCTDINAPTLDDWRG